VSQVTASLLNRSFVILMRITPAPPSAAPVDPTRSAGCAGPAGRGTAG
jgi:hypothetical protein